MRTRSSWIWCWVIGAVLASGAGAQQYTTIIDNLPTCTGNRNGRVISVSDAVSDTDCTVGGATGTDRFVHQCICDTLNALGPYWKAVGGSGGAGLTDGDYGDITVGGTGTTMAIDANAVTEPMLKVVNACTDEYVLTCETTTGDFEWQAAATGTIGGTLTATDDLLTCTDGTGGSTIGACTVGNLDNLRLDGNTISSTSGGSINLFADGGGAAQFTVGAGGSSWKYALAGSGDSPLSGYARQLFARTQGVGAPLAMPSSASSQWSTNEGATAETYVDLPGAETGLHFTACVQDADGFRYTAASGDTIRVIDKVTAAAGYISSTTIGSCVAVTAINATEWFATSINGTWTDGTFTFDNTSLTTP